MLERLAVLEHNKGEEVLEQITGMAAITTQQALQLDVVKTAARQLAQEIAVTLTKQKVADLATMIGNEIREPPRMAEDW